MDHYNGLLKEVIGHIRGEYSSAATASLSRGASRHTVLPKASETPRTASDFELITWLITK